MTEPAQPMLTVAYHLRGTAEGNRVMMILEGPQINIDWALPSAAAVTKLIAQLEEAKRVCWPEPPK